MLNTLDKTSSTGATCNLVCCVICVESWYVKLIYWSIHLVNLFHMTQQIGQEHKLLNLYRRAYNLFVVRHVGTSTARRARHNERVESCRLSRCDVTKLVEFGPFLARHVTSLHDSTRSTCRTDAFWLCRACLDWCDIQRSKGLQRYTTTMHFCSSLQNGDNCRRHHDVILIPCIPGAV